MASRKNSNGYYKTTITYNGKKYQIYAKSRQELFEKEKEKRAELEAGRTALLNPTLFQYYEHFTRIRQNEIKESTVRSQKSQFKTVSSAVMADGNAFGDMRIKEITRRHILDVRQSLLDSGKTPENLNNCFAHLNHVFSSAVLDKTIPENPCANLNQLKRKKKAAADTIHRALTQEETERFFAAAAYRNSYYLNAFLVMIKTGMRLGELTALYPADMDRKNGFIHVKRTITRTDTGSYIVGADAKTNDSARDIPLTDEVYQILQRQRELNIALFGMSGYRGLIFRSVQGEILREYSLNREIKRICKAAAVEEFTCHAFRNTFATRFIEQRPQDYKILSQILGHKDISITLNLYTHVMTENKVTAMNEILIKTS